MEAVLLWALPDDWVQFELLAPDLVASVDADMRRRFAGSDVEEEALSSLIGSQVQAFQDAAGDRVVLVAARARQEAGAGHPPPGPPPARRPGERPPPRG